MKEIVILSAVRTPIGKFGGSLLSQNAVDLGTIAAKAAIERAKIEPGVIDETIFGHARQAGNGPNTARQIAHRAGVPDTKPAFTVNKACGSGLKSIILGLQAIILGDASFVLAGGTESMSQTPFLLTNARFGYRMGHNQVVDGMYRDGFMCPLCGQLMGETAENLVEKYKLTRHQQDEYSVETQRRAETAQKTGRFQDEITPVEVDGKKGEKIKFVLDEHLRHGTTLESLAKLEPVFKKNGTVHAGNSSGITDGAAAVILSDADQAKHLPAKPIAKIKAYTSVGVDPAYMGIGPVPAIKKLLEKTNLKLQDIGLVELNEAFAAQVLACDKELNFDWQTLNVNGGAIALGHPIGCTGTRITVTLLHEMKKRNVQYGLATLCVSGGMGMAVLFENIN